MLIHSDRLDDLGLNIVRIVVSTQIINFRGPLCVLSVKTGKNANRRCKRFVMYHKSHVVKVYFTVV